MSVENPSAEQGIAQLKEALARKTEELASAKQRYALAEEATNEGMWDWNLLTKENFRSPRWKALLGFSENELPDTADIFFKHIHPEDEARVNEAIRDHCEARAPYDLELRLRCKDGGYRWFRTRGQSVRDASGRVIRMAGSILDVTDQKLANQQLRESEARFRGTFDNAAVGMVHLSLEGHYLLANQCFCDIVGYSADELVGTRFKDITHPDDYPNDLAQSLRMLAGEMDVYTREKRYMRKNGEPVWASLTVSLQRDATGNPKYFIGVIRDISARKRGMEHLGFVIQELSHRSKNLLAVVQAMANHSSRTSSSMEDFRRRFSLRLQGLSASHDLLVQQNWEKGDLAELVVRQLAPFDEGGDRLDAGGPNVSLDAGAVQNVGLLFHELAANTSKYGALSVPEGKVVIRWEIDAPETERRSLRVSWTERGGPAVKEPDQKGFGLIVIERTVAAALNGTVSVDFASDGLTCTLQIPTSHVICRSA